MRGGIRERKLIKLYFITTRKRFLEHTTTEILYGLFAWADDNISPYWEVVDGRHELLPSQPIEFRGKTLMVIRMDWQKVDQNVIPESSLYQVIRNEDGDAYLKVEYSPPTPRVSDRPFILPFATPRPQANHKIFTNHAMLGTSVGKKAKSPEEMLGFKFVEECVASMFVSYDFELNKAKNITGNENIKKFYFVIIENEEKELFGLLMPDKDNYTAPWRELTNLKTYDIRIGPNDKFIAYEISREQLHVLLIDVKTNIYEGKMPPPFLKYCLKSRDSIIDRSLIPKEELLGIEFLEESKVNYFVSILGLSNAIRISRKDNIKKVYFVIREKEKTVLFGLLMPDKDDYPSWSKLKILKIVDIKIGPYSNLVAYEISRKQLLIVLEEVKKTVYNGKTPPQFLRYHLKPSDSITDRCT